MAHFNKYLKILGLFFTLITIPCFATSQEFLQIHSCRPVKGKPLEQICWTKGILGKLNDRVAIYSERSWVGSGSIVRVHNKKHKITFIRVEESSSYVKKGFNAVNQSVRDSLFVTPDAIMTDFTLY